MNTTILDRPIAFHRCFVSLTGSVNAALMLSQALYWQRRNEDGKWWFQTREKWTDETGLTRDEQETARKRLSRLAFWKEELQGIPAKLYFFVDMELLMQLLSDGASNRVYSTHPVGCIPPNKEAAFLPAIVSKETKEETYLIPSLFERVEKPSENPSSNESLTLAIYKSYPRKASKQDALKAIEKALKKHSFNYLLERTAKYAEYTRAWPKSELRYIPYPASWFNAGSFEDDESNWIKEVAPESFHQLTQKAFALRTAIQEHVANREYIGASDNPTKEQLDDLRELRKRLSEVEAKMASSRK